MKTPRSRSRQATIHKQQAKNNSRFFFQVMLIFSKKTRMLATNNIVTKDTDENNNIAGWYLTLAASYGCLTDVWTSAAISFFFKPITDPLLA